jgi:pyruvate-formate lyase
MGATKQQRVKTEEATSPWHGFRTGPWQKEINVRDFIQQNTNRTTGIRLSWHPPPAARRAPKTASVSCS